MFLFLLLLFCQHNSTNPRPYFKLLHRTSVLTPRTPQGGGSPSVLLTLYKAGGACFPRLDFFLVFFMFDFNRKRCSISVKSFGLLKQMSFKQRKLFFCLLYELSRVTRLCLLKNNKKYKIKVYYLFIVGAYLWCLKTCQSSSTSTNGHKPVHDHKMCWSLLSNLLSPTGNVM